MGEKREVKVLIEGGKATGGPPIGPAIGPLGVNVAAVIERVNELTREFAGMRVPVKIIVDLETKEFEVEVGIPTTSALIARDLKIEKGSEAPGRDFVGNLKFEQVIKIAKIKWPQSYARTLKGVVKEVLGSCVSMGILVDGKDPKQVTREVDEGKYDNLLSKIDEPRPSH